MFVKITKKQAMDLINTGQPVFICPNKVNPNHIRIGNVPLEISMEFLNSIGQKLNPYLQRYISNNKCFGNKLEFYIRKEG